MENKIQKQMIGTCVSGAWAFNLARKDESGNDVEKNAAYRIQIKMMDVSKFKNMRLYHQKENGDMEEITFTSGISEDDMQKLEFVSSDGLGDFIFAGIEKDLTVNDSMNKSVDETIESSNPDNEKESGSESGNLTVNDINNSDNNDSDDSVNLCSPSPDVDGVSGSPYTSSNHQTDGQPNCSGSDCLQHSFPDSKPGRGLPSIDDTSEDDVDKDMSAVSRMKEKNRINSLYDTIYREISLTPGEEEFAVNIKNAAAEADVENMDASDRAEIFCSLLERNVNTRRLVKVKGVLNLKYYSFAKERQYEPVGKLLKEFEKYCFLQMPISEQLKEYYGANKPFYEIAREQNLLNGNPYDERKKADVDEAGKHFTGELSMTTYYVANRYHSKTKCYLIPDEMKNCKNILADISSIYLRMVEYISSEADTELRKGLKKYIDELKPARFVLLNAYFKFMEDYVLAEDINKLIDSADIVDAGSCQEDSQFCDMYTRYDQYGASMLRLARTLNLVSAEYCDVEPLKLIFDLD